MDYCFDLDGTICCTHKNEYNKSVPYHKVIKRVNDLYDKGETITIFTARGGTSGTDHNQLTVEQLKKWNVRYHRLIDKNKPHFDLLIDDKAINASTWRKQNRVEIVGVVASSFDLLHAGHCLYLEDAKSKCDKLIACLQTDPTIDRPEKNKPIQSFQERKIQILNNKNVDEVREYSTEDELCQLIKEINPDIRILGSDYNKNSNITGIEYCKELYFHNRDYKYSSTELRKRIYDSR